MLWGDLQKTIDFSIHFMGPIVFYRKLQLFIENYRFFYRISYAMVFYRKLQIFLKILQGLQFSTEICRFFYSFLQNSIYFSIDFMGSTVFCKIIQETIDFLQHARGLQFSQEYLIQKNYRFFYRCYGAYSFLQKTIDFSIENYRFFYGFYGAYSFLQKTIDFSIDFMGLIVFYRKLQIFYSLLKNSIDFSIDCMGSIVFYRILQETIHFLQNSRGLQFSKEYFIEKLQIFLQILWGLQFSIENYRFFYSLLKNSIDFSIDCMGSIVFYRILQETIHFLQNSRGLQFSKEYFIEKLQIFLQMLWGLQFSIENYRFFYSLLKNSIDFSIDCMGSIVFYRIIQETIHFLQNSRGLQFSKEYFIEKLQIFLYILWGLQFSIENYSFLQKTIDFSIDFTAPMVFYRKLYIFLKILHGLQFSTEIYRFFYSFLQNSIDFSIDFMGSIVFCKIIQETIDFLQHARGLQFSKEYFIEKLQIFLQMLRAYRFLQKILQKSIDFIENYTFFYRFYRAYSFLLNSADFYNLQILQGLQFSIEFCRLFYRFYRAYTVFSIILNIFLLFYKQFYRFVYICYGSIVFYKKLQIFYKFHGVYRFIKNILQKTIDLSIDFMGPIVFYRKVKIFLEFRGPMVFYCTLSFSQLQLVRK